MSMTLTGFTPRTIRIAAALAALLTVSSFGLAPVSADAGGAHRHDHANTKTGSVRQIAQSGNTIDIHQTRLNDHLVFLSGSGGFSGGNVVASVGPDGILLVDDKLRKMTAKLETVIGELGGIEHLKYVLNTHWHYDHVGGNATFGRTAAIVAHDNVRRRLIDKGGRIFGVEGPAAPDEALPVITFDDGLSIHFNGEEIRVRHMPAGHTDGDAVVYFTKSNVLHTGDLYFNGILPFADLKSGGDVESLIYDIEMLIANYPDDATVVPGHGPLTTMEGLKTYHRMLMETTAHVAAMMEGGKSLEEIKAAGVPAEWQDLGGKQGQSNWNANIYASLSR